MGRRSWFPGNAVEARTTLHGPNPITTFEVGSTDAAWGRGLSGHTGSVIIGEPSSPARRYAGDLGPLQNFRGGAFLGRTPDPRPGPNQALPSTGPPPAGPNAMVDLLGRMP
ncbi:MAG: hypothetical protein ACR2MO_08590 [Acidimicrobiales bacterium]